MKIKMIDLLVKIANDEAPNKIAYNSVILEYQEEYQDYYPYYSQYLFEHKFATCNDFLNDEVEIIEEPKKIEYPILHKTAPSEKTGDQMPNWRSLIDCNFEYLNKTICQLIDEINNLKEKK